MRASALLALLLWLAPSAFAERLDWEVDEEPAGAAVTWARGARDGFLGIFDAVTDLQLGLFSEGALLAGSAMMLVSDTVGLIDDNPATQYLLKGTLSKSVAQTAFLLHIAGSEAVLGSHGLAREWYLEAAFVELNPLVDEPAGPRLPLDPLDFVGEGLLHANVYRARFPGSVLGASLVADGVLRPTASLLRIAGFVGAADRVDTRATRLVRRTVE